MCTSSARQCRFLRFVLKGGLFLMKHYKSVARTCKTCEYKSGGICIVNNGDKTDYLDNIFNGKCQDWDISYPEFSKLLDSLDEKIISRKQFDKFMDEYYSETEN